MSRTTVLVFVLLFCLPGCAAMQNGTLANILNADTGHLDGSTVAAGLKEALRVGTERSTLSLGAVDGYLANELIRIAIPDDLRGVTDKLRRFGMASYVDEFEVGMNRAAEVAAGEAREVFWDAITSMSIADAFAILDGGDNAATDYFVGRTRLTLTTRYRPIVRQKMREVGLSRLYGELFDLYNTIPLVEKPEMVELDEYVTDKALDGLFTIIAQEEGRIRNDPVARTTALLRKVFGR